MYRAAPSPPPGGPRRAIIGGMIVVLAGGSCSGKSTLAALVAPRVPARHIKGDHYFRTDDPAAPQILIAGQMAFDCNHPETLDLARMLADIRATPGPVLVDSHFGLYHPELRALATHTVFVACDADIRAMRRLVRGYPQRGEPQALMEEYMAGARPAFDRYIAPTQAYAELVLDGTRPPEELAETLLAYLRE